MKVTINIAILYLFKIITNAVSVPQRKVSLFRSKHTLTEVSNFMLSGILES